MTLHPGKMMESSERQTLCGSCCHGRHFTVVSDSLHALPPDTAASSISFCIVANVSYCFSSFSPRRSFLEFSFCFIVFLASTLSISSFSSFLGEVIHRLILLYHSVNRVMVPRIRPMSTLARQCNQVVPVFLVLFLKILGARRPFLSHGRHWTTWR